MNYSAHPRRVAVDEFGKGSGSLDEVLHVDELFKSRSHLWNPMSAVEFSSGGAPKATTAQLVRCDDALACEHALQQLVKHRILGVDWKADNYAGGPPICPVSLVSVSAGKKSFLFQVITPGQLPTGLVLLLTHPDFVKVACGVRRDESKAGKFFRDFGFAVRTCYDVMDNVEDTYPGTPDLEKAFAKFKRNSVYRKAKAEPVPWGSSRIGIAQLRDGAFTAWASREMFISLGSPEGLPPNLRCSTSPVNFQPMLSELQCPYSKKFFPDESSLRLYQAINHPMCVFCNRVFASEKALRKHQYARVNGRCRSGPGETGAVANIRANQVDFMKAAGQNPGDLNPPSAETQVCTPVPPSATAAPTAHTAAATHKKGKTQKKAPGNRGTSGDRRSTANHQNDYLAGRGRKPSSTAEDEPKARVSRVYASAGTYGGYDMPGRVYQTTVGKENDARRDNPQPEKVTLSPLDFDPAAIANATMALAGPDGIIRHIQTPLGAERWYDPPRTRDGPLEITATADRIGEIPA